MPVQNGMGTHGIHDHIACVPVEVTSAMVGKRIGLFVSIEAKRPGRRKEKDRGMSAPQYNNMLKIQTAAGISMVVDGEDDLKELEIYLARLRNE